MLVASLSFIECSLSLNSHVLSMVNSYARSASWMKWLAVAVPLIISNLLYAQVSQYSFSRSVATYTEIGEADGGYVPCTPLQFPPASELTCYADPEEPAGTTSVGAYLAPVRGPGYHIGFDFTYNGEVFDRIGISTAGGISFGRSSDANTAVWIFTSDHWAGKPLSHSYNSAPWPSHPTPNRSWIGTCSPMACTPFLSAATMSHTSLAATSCIHPLTTCI
jgi:hypothetical protein